MTCQSITGSDNFGPVHWSRTADGGVTWSVPAPVAAFHRRDLGGGYEEGVCDAVPEYHPPTGRVLLMGHTVFYKDDVLLPRDPPAGFRRRHSVYTVGDGRSDWSELQHLEWDNPRAAGWCMCGCAQRYTFDNGDVLVPLSLAAIGEQQRAVTTVRYAFDGHRLSLRQAGRELTLNAGRGLLEPSVVHFDGHFFLTIRAEDGHGYVSQSADGLGWEEIVPWQFEDNTPLEMSTTQQRWLIHRGRLYLVYTRKARDNRAVFRWRAPLWIARVDSQRRRLIRDSEQIVFPMIGDGMAADNHVARMGNFHTTAISAEESWITVGESRPKAHFAGDTLLARIR